MKGIFCLTILCASIVYSHSQENCNSGILLDYSGYANNYNFNTVPVQTKLECLKVTYISSGPQAASFRQFMGSARLTSTGTSINDYKKGTFKFSVPLRNFSISFDAISQDERIKVKAYREGSIVPFSQRNSDIFTNGYHSNNSIKVFTIGYNNLVDSIQIEITGLSGPNYQSFANVTFSGGCATCVTVLPIELIDFDATVLSDRTVQLQWKTLTELHNDYFLIERSEDGILWETLAEIDGAGTSNSELSYRYDDRIPFTGTSYYRLKQVDFDGQFKFSHIVFVTIDQTTEQLSVYPNPFTERITVEAKDLDDSTLKFIDLTGQNMMDKVTMVHSSQTTVLFNTLNLPSGVYFIIAGEQRIKIVKQ